MKFGIMPKPVLKFLMKFGIKKSQKKIKKLIENVHKTDYYKKKITEKKEFYDNVEKLFD